MRLSQNLFVKFGEHPRVTLTIFFFLCRHFLMQYRTGVKMSVIVACSGIPIAMAEAKGNIVDITLAEATVVFLLKHR
ncbi:MAG TPA: hypothetical protein VGT05_01205 [Patescibacteria group bacterium]|nr:hypothetical protein [Patescibacteria group bacterium]